MFYVYILQSLKNKRLYRGLVTDLRRRLAEHNSGNVTSTKIYRPWKLIYYEAFSSKIDARREELEDSNLGRGRETGVSRVGSYSKPRVSKKSQSDFVTFLPSPKRASASEEREDSNLGRGRETGVSRVGSYSKPRVSKKSQSDFVTFLPSPQIESVKE